MSNTTTASSDSKGVSFKPPFYCRMHEQNAIRFDDLKQATDFADENAVYGCNVTDSEGNVAYAPYGEFASDVLFHAKAVCDFVRDNEFNYGDAPINPAINCDAKLVSCDRMVGWVLYRLGYTDQPRVQGLCVSGPRMTNWCIEHDFTRIDSIDELLPGDLVFTKLNKYNCPGHVFLFAGRTDEPDVFLRYDCGKVERIRSTQPSREGIGQFMYGYRAHPVKDDVTPSFSFLYDGVPFADLDKKVERTDSGILYTLPDGVQVECRVRRFDEQRVFWWCNYWHNPTNHDSGLITELWDCDITVPIEPDTPRTRRNRQSTWEYDSTQLFVTKGANVKDDDNFAKPRRLWEGDSYTAACAAGRSGYGTAPFFDVNRRDKGVILAVGWTGQWHAIFDRGFDTVRIRSGIQHAAAFRIRPSESFRTASSAVMRYYRGQNEAHNRWRHFMGEISPIGGKGRGEHCPFSAIFWGGITSENLIRRWQGIIDAGLPLDTCWIDAGWYEPLCGETTEEQSAEWSNIGLWEVSKKYHPDGYRDVVDFLHSHNKGMMVWFEPERIRRSIAEWTKFITGKDPNVETALTALNDDEATDDVIELISSKISELSLDCYRQDCNIAPLNFWLETDEPERAGITEIKYINNLYRFWDALLERFPHLLIDNCAGGGHRNDVEMLSRSVPLWRSDFQCTWDCCPEANQIQNQGAAWWYPYSGIGYGPTLGDTYSFRSAYTSGITIRTWEHVDPEWDFGAMNEPMDWAKKYFDEYSSLQHYFTRDYYPLIAPSRENISWSASQFHNPDDSTGIILAFRRARCPHASADVVLGGLSLHATYEFTDLDTGSTWTAAGLDLSSTGMTLHIDTPRKSLLLRYRPV